MTQPSTAQQTSSPAPPTPGDAGTGVLQRITSWFSEASALLSGTLELAALELRRAAELLLVLLVGVMVLGLLLLSALWAVAAALVLWLMSFGWPFALAMLSTVPLHLMAAALCARWVQHFCRQLLFPATLRGLQPGASSAPLSPGESEPR